MALPTALGEEENWHFSPPLFYKISSRLVSHSHLISQLLIYNPQKAFWEIIYSGFLGPCVIYNSANVSALLETG